jgi:hypothetical protein
MSHEIDVKLNLISQGFISHKDAEDWFLVLDDTTQFYVIQRLVYFILQSGAKGSDAESAVVASGLKHTFTPCTLILSGPLKIQLSKIANLPASERKKSFRLLMTLYVLVDEKRRNTECKMGCSHWWHNSEELRKSLINGST